MNDPLVNVSADPCIKELVARVHRRRCPVGNNHKIVLSDESIAGLPSQQAHEPQEDEIDTKHGEVRKEDLYPDSNKEGLNADKLL